MTKYKCAAYGDCVRADTNEIFERSAGEDLKCPGCQQTLTAILGTDNVGTDTGSGKMPLVAIGVAVLAVLAGGGYYFSLVPAPVVTPGIAPSDSETKALRQKSQDTLAMANNKSLVPAPVVTPGIAPSDSETKALRQKSQDTLTSGDAASAEQAGAKAVANEMIKLALAKMTQGKLVEAEKELLEARALDPKQPLVAYNVAILRLKQGRRDDALKEFEASFMLGFSHFDKMDQDPDLVVMRKDARFNQLVAQYRNRSDK